MEGDCFFSAALPESLIPAKHAGAWRCQSDARVTPEVMTEVIRK
jgi:hypothetical protein